MRTHTTPGASDPVTAFRGSDIFNDAVSYWIDAWQRGILTLNVLRERSAGYEKHAAKLAPHVLKFECELIADGRKLPRPVNYVLVRVKPPKGVTIETSGGLSSSSIRAPVMGLA